MNKNLYFKKKINRRAAIYTGIKVLVFSAIVGRIYKLQVIDSDKYKTLAEENRIGLVIHMPSRGLIYDMDGMIVASNKVHYTLSMTSVHINDLNALIIKLNEFIKLDNQEVDLMKHVYAEKNPTQKIPPKSGENFTLSGEQSRASEEAASHTNDRYEVCVIIHGSEPVLKSFPTVEDLYWKTPFR